MKSPNLYVIAGPNGAGKTTFAREFLPKFAFCPKFVNADLIASGLAPFEPQNIALEAGKVMLGQIKELAKSKESFGFETTLSGRSYMRLFRQLRHKGYKIHLIFLWLPHADIAVQRVRDRVRQGGHSVPEADIRRRFERGLKNFFKNYVPLSETWLILDNSTSTPKPLAFGAGDGSNFATTKFQSEIRRYLE
jgi:predicted ABC-type ATPase